MKKVAIVGVEGSGKTVMLAGLGPLYFQQCDGGCFLGPQAPETRDYVRRVRGRLQSSQWPDSLFALLPKPMSNAQNIDDARID